MHEQEQASFWYILNLPAGEVRLRSSTELSQAEE